MHFKGSCARLAAVCAVLALGDLLATVALTKSRRSAAADLRVDEKILAHGPAQLGPWRHPSSSSSSSRNTSLSFFLLDGVGSDVFEAELAAGRLPNIAALAAVGARVRRAVTAFPSVTGYAFVPYITGQDASQSGVFGMRWFNRQLPSFRNSVGAANGAMERDLAKELVTVYEAAPQSAHTFSAMTFMARGADVHVKSFDVVLAKYRRAALIRFVCLFYPCPTWFELESAIMRKAERDLLKDPAVQFVVLSSIDCLAHTDGYTAQRVQLLRWMDTLIGRYIQTLEALGIDKNRLFVVAADHGLEDSRHWIDIGTELARAYPGMKTYRDRSTTLSSRLRVSTSFFSKYDVVNGINCNDLSLLYVKSPTGWPQRPTHAELCSYGRFKANLPKTLAGIQGVQFIIFHGPDAAHSVRVFSAAGESEVWSEDGVGVVSYTLLSGADPLEFLSAPGDSQARTPNEWLESTFNSTFPYAPVRIWRLLHGPLTPDIVVNAAPGYDFGEDYEIFIDRYLGGHGALHKGLMQVPIVFSGPGVQKGAVLETATTEDAGSTIFQLLFGAPPKGVLGKPINAVML